MAKMIPDAALDAALAYVAACDMLNVCTAEPTTYGQATTLGTYRIADVAVTPGDGNGDFVIANGDVSGRKLTVQAQSAVPIDQTGDATHVALTLAAGTTLRLVTTCTTQTLTSGGTVDVPAFKWEITDPT